MTGSLATRPGMQAMLAYLRKHSKKGKHRIVVIIDDISRLARGIEAHLKLRTAIGSAGGILQEALEGFASRRFETQGEVKRFLESQPTYPKDCKDGTIRFQRVTDLLSRLVYAGLVEAPKWNVSRRKGRHEPLISVETVDGGEKVGHGSGGVVLLRGALKGSQWLA